MRVLFIVGREISYPRNEVLLRAFKRFAQVEVLGSRRPPSSLIVRSLTLTAKSIPRVINKNYDLVFVGFFGHLLMLPIGVLSRRPILFDAFVSTYDTFVQDRQLFSESSIRGKLALWLDIHACRNAWRVLLDTPLHCKYFIDQFSLPIEKLFSLPVGCNEDLFFPQPSGQQAQFAELPYAKVLYYSSYLPLHGVDIVVQAAALLRSERISFRLIGAGQEYNRIRHLADEMSLTNIDFVAPVPLEQLPNELAGADICLGGHFSTGDKAGRVIPGKVYQILATERPLIAGDTPANRDFLTHNKNAFLCQVGNPEALAAAIFALHNDSSMCFRLASEGRKLYETICSEAVITQRLYDICQLSKS